MWLRWLICVTVCFIAITGCSDESGDKGDAGEESPFVFVMPEKPQFLSVLPQEAYSLIENEKSLVVVDVRTEVEREQARIADSTAVPLSDILQGRVELPGDRPLLLVCAVGGRSYAAGLYLMKHKYRLVYNLRGGINAWEKEGFPLVYGEK